MKTQERASGAEPLTAEVWKEKDDTEVRWLGGAGCALSLAGFVALIICAATVGCAPWLWAVCGLALLNGAVLVALGVQGAYMNRMYDELKGRPLYILAESINTQRE